MKRILLLLVATAALAGIGYALLWNRAHAVWPEWQVFKRDFIQPDGRVVDRTAQNRTVSEAQAYALFFALVGNDRQQFETLLRWTEDNLAQGDLSSHLPAWLWGDQGEGRWGVLDPNPASDADLWLAYALAEAARLWEIPAYEALARDVLANVKAREVAGAGGDLLLLPAPEGFRLEDGGWRLNPSYYAEHQLRYFAGFDPDGPWQTLWDTHLRHAEAIYASGFAPDWYVLDAGGTPAADPVNGAKGGYDAIRVYLWAGMVPWSESGLLPRLRNFAEATRRLGAPPEFVDSGTGEVSGGQPLGFSGAVLPFLEGLGEERLAQQQRQRLAAARSNGSLGTPPHYYDQVLALFGEGWARGLYRFNRQGQLEPRWESLWYAR